MKHRILWLTLISLLALGLATLALAAADRVPDTPPAAEVTPPPVVAPQVYQPSQPSPFVTNPAGELAGQPETVTGSQPDDLSEQMRQQVMAAARQPKPAPTLSALPDSPGLDGAQASPASTEGGNGYVNPGLTFDLVRDQVYGRIDPYATITFSRQGDGAYGAAQADGVGFFWTPLMGVTPAGWPTDLQGGDAFDYWINGSYYSVTLPAEATGFLNLSANQVIGNLPGAITDTAVTVTLGMWGETSDIYGIYGAVTDGFGNFSLTTVHDIGAENFATFEYQAKTGVYVRSYVYSDPHAFILRHNNSVMGYAPRDTNVHLTVFEGSSPFVRWEGETIASAPFGWFEFWNVELVPGDRVTIDYADGNVSTTYTYASNFSFNPATRQVFGQTDPNREVRVSSQFWWIDQYVYQEAHAISDPSGWFTATLPDELRPSSQVEIVVADVAGNQTAMISGPPFVEAIINPENNVDCLHGRVDSPNATITVSLFHGGQWWVRDAQITGPSDPGNNAPALGICYLIRGFDEYGNPWGPINFDPGDIVRLQSPTWTGEVTVADIQWHADNANDRVIGSAANGLVEVSLSHYGAGETPEEGSALTLTSAAPDFSAQFVGYDVRDNGNYIIRHFDPTTDYVTNLGGLGNLLRYAWVEGWWEVGGYTPIPDEYLEATLYDELMNPLASTSEDRDGEPYWFRFEFPGYPIQPGYTVMVTNFYDWSTQIWVPYLTLEGDSDQGHLSGDAPQSLLYVWGRHEDWSQEFDAFVPVDDTGAYIYAPGYEGYILQPRDRISASYFSPEGDQVVQHDLLGEVTQYQFWMMDSGRTWMWGEAEMGSYVTVWLPREPYSMTAYADPNCDGCFGFDHVYLYPGESVIVTTDEGGPPLEIPIPNPLEAHADSLTGEVWGQIGGWDNREVEIYNWWGEPMITATTDINGYFLATWPWMPRGGRGHIRFIDQINNTSVNFHRTYLDLEPQIAANFAHEWIEGNYEPGHTLWITLTNALGELKATGSGTTAEIPWWNGETGWSTSYNTPLNIPWSELDLQPGDWIYVRFDNGQTGELRLPEITGNLDLENEIVSGNFVGDWLTGTVYGDCGVWGNVPNAPGMGFEAYPPDYSYTCDFASLGFNLQAGMEVGVGYSEPAVTGPDNDRVYNVFRQPAPHLWNNIWGEGTPAWDTNYMLHVQYNNDGDAMAPGVVITHALWGMVYLTDTSGLPHIGTGDPADPLVWQVGDLEPSQSSAHDFYVFAHVVNPPGSGLYADVQMHTPLQYYQSDEDRKYSGWGWDPVPEPNVEINIGKNAWTWDPAPGSDFIYAVNSCNNGDTSSGWVIVTDTLPLSTTLVNWWGQNPGWMEVARSDHELVVTRPTVQEHWCSEVYLLVQLDDSAWPGMQLHNVADVWSSYDWDPNNNHTEVWHNVALPHPNLSLGSNWIYGQHVPGGSIGYEFAYYNSGNVAVDGALVTATLPAGTIFDFGFTWDYLGWRIYPPDLVVSPTLTQDGYAVWNTGHLVGGFRRDMGVWLHIDSAVQPGTPLDLQIDITPLPWEDRYNDNTLLYQEGVYDPGPNLRVDKHTNWNWEQWGQDDYLINHELRIMNFGTEYLEDVWITDTLPASSHLESWWKNHGPDPMFAFEQDGQVVFYVHHLNPGETVSFGYRFRFDPGTIQQGMAFTDYLEAPIEGDVNPVDNFDSLTAYTGPDVFIHKYLSGGIPEPGAIVTFTVEFGNQTRWWNGDGGYPSLILDTLPEGMTYITATAPWTPDENWAPWLTVDDTLIWMWGPMWSESLWWYELVVQLDPDLAPGQELVNRIEAYGQSPNDIDPHPENNLAEYTVTVLAADVVLGPPAQAASASPGENLTYNLTLTNTGSVPDTFAISASSLWPTQLSDTSSGLLQPGESFTFSLQVSVPVDAQEGQQDTALLTVQSGYDAAVSATASATTTVSIPYYWQYLPLINKQ